MRSSRFVAPASSHEYCLNLVRNFDNENFVVNTLLPQAGRKAHVALRAFSVEIARVRSTVSNEDLGRLRMQFFRDSLGSIISTRTTHLRSPVLEVLTEAKSSNPGLDLACLHTMVDARERDLAYPNIRSLTDLTSLAADLQAPLIQSHGSMLLQSASDGRHGVEKSPPSTDLVVAARFAGEAVGLAILLRGAPALAANRLCYAPADVLRAQGMDAPAVMSGGPAAAAVYGVVAERAEHALRLASDAVKALPRAAHFAFWCLALPRIYLPRLKRAGGDPFDENLQHGMQQTYPLRLQLALLRKKLLG